MHSSSNEQAHSSSPVIFIGFEIADVLGRQPAIYWQELRRQFVCQMGSRQQNVGQTLQSKQASLVTILQQSTAKLPLS